MAGPYQGRALRLPVPVDVEHMGDLADAASISVRANTGQPLSFEPSSVSAVDGFLGEIAEEGGGSDELAELIVKLGAYVGELMVRYAGGRWVDPPTELGSGWPAVVLLPSGYYATPLDRAFKRVDNGTEDSLTTFWEVATAKAQARRPWWRRR